MEELRDCTERSARQAAPWAPMQGYPWVAEPAGIEEGERERKDRKRRKRIEKIRYSGVMVASVCPSSLLPLLPSKDDLDPYS